VRVLRSDGDPERALAAWALLGTVAVLLVVSAFDAVLLLPAPALVSWGLLGALSPPSRPRVVAELPTPRRVAAMLLVTILGGLAILRSGRQVAAMAVFEASTRAGRMERAAELDPGNYRIRMRLADGYARRGSCRNVRTHAEAARALFPNAAAPKRLLAACRK